MNALMRADRWVAIGGLLASFWLCSVGIVSATGRNVPRSLTLGSGRLSDFGWEVTLARDAGASGGQRPCIGVGAVNLHAPVDQTFQRFLKTCGALTPRTPPNIVSLSVGSNTKEVSVVGMAFASSIVALRVDGGSLGEKELKLKLLNEKQAENGRVSRVRYTAFAAKGPFCLGRITAYGKTGNVLFEAAPEPCAKQYE